MRKHQNQNQRPESQPPLQPSSKNNERLETLSTSLSSTGASQCAAMSTNFQMGKLDSKPLSNQVNTSSKTRLNFKKSIQFKFASSPLLYMLSPLFLQLFLFQPQGYHPSKDVPNTSTLKMQNEPWQLSHLNVSSTPPTPNQSTETDPVAAPKPTLDIGQVFHNLKKQQKPSTESTPPNSRDSSSKSGDCTSHPGPDGSSTTEDSEQVSRPRSICSKSSSSIPGAICRLAAACAAAQSRPFRMPVPCKHFDRLQEPEQLSSDSDSTYSSESSLHIDLTDDHAKLIEQENGRTKHPRPRPLPPPLCRICLCASNSEHERLLRPCNCRGPFTFAHQHCLVEWLRASQSDACDVCRFRFVLQRCSLPCSRYFRQPAIQRRLLGGILVAMAGVYILSTAHLTIKLLSQRRLFISILVRWFLVVCTHLWTVLFAVVVCWMSIWQSIDFWHWRTNSFDLRVPDNPNNLLRDQGVPPRDLIRTSGLRQRRKAAK